MPTEIQTHFNRSLRTKTCASQLFGSWMVEPKWFAQAIEAVRSGKLKPRASEGDEDDEKRKPLTVAELDDDYAEDEEKGYKIVNVGGRPLAVICIEGTMLKYRSSFGGCSTVEVRRAVRAAKNDRMVHGIMLYIDSPGGSCSGTSDLAADVVAAAGTKPLYAYFANMGASAAYWVGSQADAVWGNEIALVGSIGTYCVLEDDTQLNEEIGIKLTVVSTGPFKGLGADGKVTDQLISDVQREIDDLNERFLVAVAAGREMEMTKVRALADGRVHVGEKAVQEGLVDVIGTFDAALQALSQEKPKMITKDQFDAYAAEHPDAVQPFVKQGHEAGQKAERIASSERIKTVRAACPGRADLALDLLEAGKSADDAKIAVGALDREKAAIETATKSQTDALAAAKAENERLKAELGTQGALPLAGAAKKENEKQAQTPPLADGSDPEAQAKAEWAKMPADQKSSWRDEKTFVSARKAELQGLTQRAAGRSAN
jgi:signal peptide peptidase SppA